MAPDRPDGTDVENGRAIGPAASSTGPVVTRVFGFCDALSLREPTEQLVQPAVAHFVEGPALVGDEVVIEEESVVPIIKQEQLQQQGQEEKPGQSDDELTSLSWLHQQNLLKGLEISEQPGGGGGSGGGVRNIKREHLAGEDSLDVSENTNSVSSLDDSYSHESNGHNSSVDSLTVLNYDEVVINGLSGQGNAVQDGSSSPDGTTGPRLIGNHNNNNNNANANFNLPVPNRNKHPTHIPYDPYLHKNCKPPYSFSSLIFMAIEDSPVKALPVKEVYAWILEHFPYFRNAPTGWKNSVRHNLSLNKCFRKVEKSPHLGKGSLWMVDAQYRPNLIQALSRTPCPPPTVLNMSPQEKICATRNVNVVNGVSNSNSNSNNNNNNNNSSSYNNNNNNNNNSHNNHNNNNNNISKSITTGSRLPDPVLFPYLSKRLASSSLDENSTEAIEFDSDVDAAAAAMLAFKHGPIILNHTKVERKRKPSTEKKMQVITRNSNEDHTYSLVTSVRLERREVCHDANDVDEQRKIAEGADALLNLAGVTTTPPRDPLAVDPVHIQQREEDEEEEDEGYEDMSLLYGTNKNVPRYIPGSDPLEVRPVKRRSSGSKDGPNKRRKRFWREPWTENGRYPKQVRG